MLFSPYVMAAAPLISHSEENASSFFWTPETMLTTKLVTDVQIAPDNASAVYIAIETPSKGEELVTHSKMYRFCCQEKKTELLTSDTQVSFPRWSPNGKQIAFLTKKEGKKQIYLLSSSTEFLTETKEDVQTFAWAPDSSKIAFVMKDKEGTKETNRLWIIDIDSKHVEPITPPSYCVRGSGDFGLAHLDFDWSPDSTKIVFAYSPSLNCNDRYLHSSIASIDIASKEILLFEKNAEHESLPRYSLDGKYVAYLSASSPHLYAINGQVALFSSDGHFLRQLAPTFNEGPLINHPYFLEWTKKGDALLFLEPNRTKMALVRVPMDGSASQLLSTHGVFFKNPSLSRDRTMLGMSIQAPHIPPEAYITVIEDFSPQCISSLNAHLKKLPEIKTEIISWIAEDGLAIEGLLTYPIGYTQGQKYPLLLMIHGGPMGVFDETFIGTPYPYPIAAFAQKDFFILRPNPRGSSGYGKAFRTANYKDWGGADFLDLMTGVDKLISQDMIDTGKMGVMGWSYGGYMTGKIVTTTNRFQKASLGAGIFHLSMFEKTTDIPDFVISYCGTQEQDLEFYDRHSPISFASQVKTPCLFQHGTEDLRVPSQQSNLMHEALLKEGVTSTLSLYPNAAHDLANPNQKLQAMKENISWFSDLDTHKSDL